MRTTFATALLVLAAGAAFAGDDLLDLLESLKGDDDPGARRAAVAALVKRGGERSAGALAKSVRTDPDPLVRAAAALGLGRIESGNALRLLLELQAAGGVHQVKLAVADGLARRKGGPEAVLALLDDSRLRSERRDLVVETLGAQPGLAVVERLEGLAGSDDAHDRVQALRALGTHAEGRALLPGILASVLHEHHDAGTVLTALDLACEFADADFKPLAKLLDTFLDPRVERSVAAARARLEYIDALAGFNRKAGTVYEEPAHRRPEPPPPRPRLDVVYVFDATGSVVAHMDLIRKTIRTEAELLQRVGTDLRIGIVAFRDNARRASRWVTKPDPLAYDVDGALAFIDGLDAGGTDSRGAAVEKGLAAAMDRMVWRPKAQRQVVLIADSKTSDPERAMALARIHRSADRLRLHVWYLLRTRGSMPDDIGDLARVGGGSVKVLE